MQRREFLKNAAMISAVGATAAVADDAGKIKRATRYSPNLA